MGAVSDYPGLMIQWKLFHPETVRERELVLAQGVLEGIYHGVPLIARVASGQVGYHRPVLLAFQIIKGSPTPLSTAVVTVRTRPQ